MRDDQGMADEPNKKIPIDPHAVPDVDPAGTEAANTPVAAETGTRAAAATRTVTSGPDEPETLDRERTARNQHGDDDRPSDTSGNGDDEKKPPIPLAYALKRAVRGFSINQVTNLAAALTYYAVLAVAPTLVALVSILGVVGDGPKIINQVLDVVKNLGAEDAVETIEPILTQVAESPGAGVALIVGVLIALWSASSYVTAFSRASNRIYGVAEGRPIWKLRPAMYLVTFSLVIIVALAAVTLVASGQVAAEVGDLIGLSSAALLVWKIVKWPLVLFLALVAIAMLYRLTPNVRQRKFRLISWGAVVAVVVWILASVGFGFYVANFSSYGATYGTLAGVIIFLLWVWISNLALLFGAQLDAELERGRQLRSGIIAEEEIQLRRRDTAASDKKDAKERKVVAEGRDIRVDLTGDQRND